MYFVYSEYFDRVLSMSRIYVFLRLNIFCLSGYIDDITKALCVIYYEVMYSFFVGVKNVIVLPLL